MNTIVAIQTKTEDKSFNSTVGRIQIEIELIQSDWSGYSLKIVESVNKVITEPMQVPIIEEDGAVTFVTKDVTHKKTLDKNLARFRPMTNDELDLISSQLEIEFTPDNLRVNIEEIFRNGLLLFTQQECINGIPGQTEPGIGIYRTTAPEWEIVRVQGDDRPTQVIAKPSAKDKIVD